MALAGSPISRPLPRNLAPAPTPFTSGTALAMATWTSPISTAAPGPTAAGFSMRAPFTNTPLAEPRSSTISAPPRTKNRACRRETSFDCSTTSQPSSRPMRSPFSSSASGWVFGFFPGSLNVSVNNGSRFFAEDVHVHGDAAPLQIVVELGHEAGGDEPAHDLPLAVEAFLLEAEDVLHGDDVHLHAGDFADGDDLARSVGEPGLLDDEVHRAGDLLADGLDGQVHAAHQDHGLEAAQRIAGGVGVQSRQGAVVAGVHGLEHVQRLAAAALAHHDAVGPH